MLIVAGGYFLEMTLHEARRSGPSKATTGTMTVLTLQYVAKDILGPAHAEGEPQQR